MLRFRECNERDCTAWIKLNRAFMSEEINDNEFWHKADRISDAEFRDVFLEGLKARDQVRFIIFEEDEEPVGFANLVLFFSVWGHGQCMIIDDFFFKRGSRGQGRGRAGMHMVEEYARSLGCKRLQLLSAPSNPGSLEFYKAIGYNPADMNFYIKYLDE